VKTLKVKKQNEELKHPDDEFMDEDDE